MSTFACGISRAMTGLRMSASIRSVRSSWIGGLRVSSPATYSTSGSASSARASPAPTTLPTPVIRTRRPPISGAYLLAEARFFGSRSSIASSRRPILRSSAFSSFTSSCVAGRRSSIAPSTALRAALQGLDHLVQDALRAVPCPLRRAAGGLDRPLDCLSERVGDARRVWCVAWPFGGRPRLSCAAVGQRAVEPIHLRPAAELAERVLLPGDPHRALAVAQALLDEPRMFNHARGLWGYTGRAPDGEPLTVQSTGMGGPSAAIVVEELIALGARRLVRIGTCGALRDGLELGTLVAAREVLPADGASGALGADGSAAARPGAHRSPRGGRRVAATVRLDRSLL